METRASLTSESGCSQRKGSNCGTVRILPQISVSAPPKLGRRSSDNQNEVQEILKEYLPEMQGAHFLSWKVPPSLRRNSYVAKQKGSKVKHVNNRRQLYLTTPMHDPDRKRVWIANNIDPKCVSLPIPKAQKPHVLIHPSPQADNLKETLMKYLSVDDKDPLMEGHRRPPSVSDISSLPVTAQGLLNRHSESFCQKRPIVEYANGKSYHVATHPDRGIPILSAPLSVFHNTRHQKVYYVIHPEWHMES